MRPTETDTTLYSGLQQEPGSTQTRSRCVAASIGPKAVLNIGSVQSITVLPGFIRVSVFLPEKRSVRPRGAQQPPGGAAAAEPRQQHRSPTAFSPGSRARSPAARLRGCGVSGLGARRVGSRDGLLQMSAGSAETEMLL